MNWIDINIICVGEHRPKIYKNDVFSIDIMNKNCNKTVKCYVKNWDILNRVQGIWYELWSNKGEHDDIIKSTWELKNNKGDKNSGGYQLYIDEANKHLLSDILNFYIECSPIKKVVFLLRHQGYEKENIQNDMPIKEFLNMFVNKKVYGNVAYILSK